MKTVCPLFLSENTYLIPVIVFFLCILRILFAYVTFCSGVWRIKLENSTTLPPDYVLTTQPETVFTKNQKKEPK